MSQPHVTDFFSSRKKKVGGNPSKRRKLQVTDETTNVFDVQVQNTQTQQPATKKVANIDNRSENAILSNLPEAKPRSLSKTNRKINGKSSKVRSSTNQRSLKEIFSVDATTDDKNDYRQAMEETTSAWDEHDGPLLTPSKRTKDLSDTDSEIGHGSRKRTRCGSQKIEVEATPLKGTDVTQNSDTKARKQLLLNQGEKRSGAEEGTPVTHDKEIIKMVEIPMSPRLKKTIEKVRQLGSTERKLSADNLKDKLKKCGRLEEIKAQLSQMSKNLKDLKTPGDTPSLKKFESVTIKPPVVDTSKPLQPSPVKQKAPAYERFHSLATPAPPTLSLPYRYKLLAEMFRNCDTVVSMLHNRAEICTFSKLKAAVQDMSKRNFEAKNLGQIKTIDEEAYMYRQEKGLPAFGQKTSGYQLTVEANLQSDETKAVNFKTRQTFTAKHLLERRTVFSNRLINIVKRYHKEFLANLDKPLNVPDDKITRWHPKFRLDEVPDIEPTDLPQPPNVQVYQTAKDVLQNARGRVLPNVEKALENVSSKQEVPTPSTDQAKNQSSEVKGIPQSLLEKIRAKEAAKMEAVMMMDPKEDKRKKMLQKLPEMMRILRAQFVQEKKPALQRNEVLSKLTDSCRSAIAMGDVEAHVNLMLEVLPKWLTQVEIKKGKYIKMNRNLELQSLITHVSNLAKS